MFRLIIVWKSDFHHSHFAGLGADELVLETGNEPPRAEFQFHSVGRAAIEGISIDPSDEVHNDLIAVFRRPAFFSRERLLLLR